MAVRQSINFGNLLGAQLTALIEAEADAARVSAEYIENVGFEKDPKTGAMKLRTVTFIMKRRDLDDKIREHMIEIPVLTLVPIPILAIEEANVEFDLEVNGIQRSTSPITAEKSAPIYRRYNSSADREREAVPMKNEKTYAAQVSQKQSRTHLMTKLARTTQGDKNVAADLNMKIKIVQSPFPSGIDRLLEVADLSVEDTVK